MEEKTNKVKFFENEFYYLSYSEEKEVRVYFSSKDILDSSEFEIIFDGWMSVKNSIFLKQVERIVSFNDLKMGYHDPEDDEEDFFPEFVLFPFFLNHNGISLVKNEEMAFNHESFTEEFQLFIRENGVQVPPYGSWQFTGLTKLNKLLFSRIYSELVLKPVIQNIRETGGYFETINTSSEELCKLDENQWVEFKETSHWDNKKEISIKREMENKGERYTPGTIKFVKETILKTICAFGNSEGGVLVIGVQDEKNGGKITGWQLDQQIKSLKNKDEFELTWRKWVSDFIDKFSSLELVFSFDSIDDKEVVRITVPPRKVEYSYASLSLKSGAQKIYTRSGNQVLEILPGEIGKVFKGRFL